MIELGLLGTIRRQNLSLRVTKLSYFFNMMLTVNLGLANELRVREYLLIYTSTGIVIFGVLYHGIQYWANVLGVRQGGVLSITISFCIVH